MLLNSHCLFFLCCELVCNLCEQCEIIEFKLLKLQVFVNESNTIWLKKKEVEKKYRIREGLKEYVNFCVEISAVVSI